MDVINTMESLLQTEELLWFEIPLNPVTKKNNSMILINPKTHRPFVSPSKKYKEYEKESGKYIPRLPEPISGQINVKCYFYRDSKRRVDLTNLLECIDDVLVKYGVIADDSFDILVSHDGSRVFVDKENPRTEILISAY